MNAVRGVVSLAGRSGPVDASVEVPGSKSLANRALVCALLADGQSTLTGLPDGDDVAVMLAALRSVDRIAGIGTDFVVTGGSGHGPLLPASVDCGLAGTTSRFLTAVASVNTSPVRLDGGGPLRGRPMGELHEALGVLGARVETAHPGHLPVTVSPGTMRGGRVRVRGDASSQFISALMLIAPVLPEGLVIELVGALVSRPYVEMTAAVMMTFGADVRIEGTEIVVAPRPYLPTKYRVEPDFSSAAFPLVGAMIAGGRVRIPGLALARLQGDARILALLRDMGAVVGVDGDDVVTVTEGAASITPVDVDMADCSDLVPAVAVALGLGAGSSRIRGIGFIRAKESNRIDDLAGELARAGYEVRSEADGLVLGGAARPRSSRFKTHEDHRLAMALSLVSLAGVDVSLDDGSVVGKSWPSFFMDMSGILRLENERK